MNTQSNYRIDKESIIAIITMFIFGAGQLTLIFLKLLNIIDWSWGIVLIPIEAVCLVIVTSVMFTFILCGIIDREQGE